MTPETLIQIRNIIEKFGFPVVVALCGLLPFAAVFGYMTKAIEKKSPVRLRMRLCDLLRSLCPDLHEIHERLGRLFQSLSRVELQLAVKIVSARK
jgi:hypothetical protein